MYIIEDKYKYDVGILSITFNYYNDDDLLDPPKLILLCRSGKPHKVTKKFDGYNYFKLIFIDPSSYSFHIGRAYYVPASFKAKEAPNMNYNFTLPFTYEMEETQLAPNHSQWVIFFDEKTKEKEFIRIWADKLEIEDLEGQPDLDKVTIYRK